MSDLFGNHIVGFPTRRLKFLCNYENSGSSGSSSALVSLHVKNAYFLSCVTKLLLLYIQSVMSKADQKKNIKSIDGFCQKGNLTINQS